MALIRNISDTAMLAAVYRARETERADSLFRDTFARRLAGQSSFKYWLLGIASPGLLKMMQKKMGQPLANARGAFNVPHGRQFETSAAHVKFLLSPAKVRRVSGQPSLEWRLLARKCLNRLTTDH